MLSEDQVNEIVIEIEHVPPGVQSHSSSSQSLQDRPWANPTFSVGSSMSIVATMDAQLFSHRNDRRHNPLLQFSTSVQESMSQALQSPECLGVDPPCPSLETIQGIKHWGNTGK